MTILSWVYIKSWTYKSFVLNLIPNNLAEIFYQLVYKLPLRLKSCLYNLMRDLAFIIIFGVHI